MGQSYGERGREGGKVGVMSERETVCLTFKNCLFVFGHLKCNCRFSPIIVDSISHTHTQCLALQSFWFSQCSSLIWLLTRPLCLEPVFIWVFCIPQNEEGGFFFYRFNFGVGGFLSSAGHLSVCFLISSDGSPFIYYNFYISFSCFSLEYRSFDLLITF